jgi:uncharacterized Tic20 family protein
MTEAMAEKSIEIRGTRHDHVKQWQLRDHVFWKENTSMTQEPDPYSVNPPSTPPPASVPPPANFPPAGGTPPLEYANDAAYMGPPPTKDDQNMAMLCYILAIFGALGWLGPLIIWLTKKETSPFINDQGREVLNWELTLVIIYAGWFLTFCIPFVNLLYLLVILAALVTNLIFCILGAMSVNKGIAYRMPFSIKFVK